MEKEYSPDNDWKFVRDHYIELSKNCFFSRTAIINYLIARNSYKYYLEIGVQDPWQNFDRVIANKKNGVDPEPKIPSGAMALAYYKHNEDPKEVWGYSHPGHLHMTTSDTFFANKKDEYDIHYMQDENLLRIKDKDKYDDEFFDNGEHKYDIVFIDGDHYHEQVDRDIENSLNCLSENGIIVMHDCGYEDGITEGNPRGTTAWRSFAKLRCTRKDLKMCVVDTDCGVGIIFKGEQEVYSKDNLCLEDGREFLPEELKDHIPRPSFIDCGDQKCVTSTNGLVHPPWLINYFEKNKKEILNLISVEEFIKIFNKPIREEK